MSEADRILDELRALADDDADALEHLAEAIIEVFDRDGDGQVDQDEIWAKIERALGDE